MKKLWPIILVIVLVLSACSPKNNDQASDNKDETNNRETSNDEEFGLNLGTGPANLKKLKMSLANLQTFSAAFTLTFDGQQDWVYKVDTRYDGSLIEYNLQLDGLDQANDPGDLRLVNDDGTNRMIGPGTDDACMQFPDEMKTGVLFLSPVDLINPDALIQDWDIREGLTYLDRDATGFTTTQDYYFGWREIQVSFFIDTATGAILNYTFDAVGADPLYGYGSGKIHGEFRVLEVGPQTIEPVTGCQIPVPIPNDAYDIVIFPGVYAYKSGLGPVKTDNHFRQYLGNNGWTRETAEINDDIREGFLIYTSEQYTLTVHIQALNPEDFSKGYQIRLYLEEK